MLGPHFQVQASRVPRYMGSTPSRVDPRQSIPRAAGRYFARPSRFRAHSNSMGTAIGRSTTGDRSMLKGNPVVSRCGRCRREGSAQPKVRERSQLTFGGSCSRNGTSCRCIRKFGCQTKPIPWESARLSPNTPKSHAAVCGEAFLVNEDGLGKSWVANAPDRLPAGSQHDESQFREESVIGVEKTLVGDLPSPAGQT